jgi:hypothetical protein
MCTQYANLPLLLPQNVMLSTTDVEMRALSATFKNMPLGQQTSMEADPIKQQQQQQQQQQGGEEVPRLPSGQVQEGQWAERASIGLASGAEAHVITFRCTPVLFFTCVCLCTTTFLVLFAFHSLACCAHIQSQP